MKDIDIEGMDKKNLREYLYSLILARKKTETEKQKLSEELDKWRTRAKLAEEKGETELKKQALLKVEEINKRFISISLELDEINTEIDKTKKNLKGTIEKINYNVNTELLLEELKILTDRNKNNKETRANREIKEIEAGIMLEELKEKLKNKEDRDND